MLGSISAFNGSSSAPDGGFNDDGGKMAGESARLWL